MDLTDIATVGKWEEFEQAIHDRCGMNACVYNIQGTRVTSYVGWANEVCPKIKAYPEGIAAICAVANQYFGKELAETKKPLIDECDAGFVKFAVPIVVKGEFLGTVGGCGHLLNGSEVETFLIEKAIGKGDLGLDKKINTVKTITDTEVNEMVVYVQDYLDGIVDPENWTTC